MPQPSLPPPDPIVASAETDEGGTTVPSMLSFSSLAWSSVLSILVLLVIAYFTFEPAAFQELMKTANLWWLIAALASLVLRVAFGAWRLMYVSRGRLTFTEAMRGQLAWDFCSNVTPSVIGGAPFAAVYIARDSRTTVGEVTAFMLFAMLLDQIWFALSVPVVLLAALYIEVIPASFGTIGAGTTVAYYLVIMCWTAFFGYATLFRPELIQRVVDRVFRLPGLRRFRDRVAREMSPLRRRARILRTQPPSFFLNGFLLTLGTWMARYLLLVFIVWSVYPALDALLVFMRHAALILSSLILPTPGGSGGIEGLYFAFLGPPLMPKALVVPTLLMWRILGYYLFLAIGVFLTTYYVQKTIQRRKMQAALAPTGGDNPQHTPPVHPEPEPVALNDGR